VLDALCDGPVPRFVNARHEAGAANMAEAHGKLTGAPGVCFVTRGPGATHGSVGLHTAFQNSTPMLFLVGQVPREELGREALQEVDHCAMLAPLAKWAAQVMEPGRIPELVRRAFTLATSGRPGPVVLVFPEDVLRELAHAPEVARYEPIQPRPAPAAVSAARERLARAQRPLMLIGGGGWTERAALAARAFAEASQLPVAASFRCQDYLDNRSPSYAGHLTTMTDPALGRRVRDADVLLVVGDRLGDVATGGYRWVDPPTPRQALIHVHPEAGELGRVYSPEIAILSGSEPFLAALEPVDGTRWAAHTEEARREYLAWSEPAPAAGALDLGAVVGHCADRLAGEAIITGDAGNFSIWVSRHLPFHAYGTQLMPQSGAMGCAIPAAIAAKLRRPDRTVVCFIGDGGFQMCGLELATAAQENLAIIVIVVSNGMYGTIRAFQEREYPGRVVATRLANPDIAAVARACGAAHAEAVERTAEFPAALERALAAGGPALLELRADPETIAPGETIAGLRATATGAR
jgi:acetolactate synthase I/II/III large subunit